jgi:putative ABC transport system substrate-binding protein
VDGPARPPVAWHRRNAYDRFPIYGRSAQGSFVISRRRTGWGARELGHIMRRRDFLTRVTGVAVAWPLAAYARSDMPVIGFLGGGSSQEGTKQLAGFRQGLKESGYTEGQNVAIEYRWADGRNDRLPSLVANLIGQQVKIVMASTTPGVAAAKAATTTTPIVFVTASDPVAAGFVASLGRPGGNLTGVTFLGAGTGPKYFQILREVVPNASVMGFLFNPTNRTLAGPLERDAKAAADSLGLTLHMLHASTTSEIDAAFAQLSQSHVGALVIGPDLLFTNESKHLAALTQRYAMPAIYHYRGFAEAGGLMSYGASLVEAYRLAGVYAARILKGTKPADLPVQQATKVEFILNLKTAKALGLNLPLPLLGRADEVIE